MNQDSRKSGAPSADALIEAIQRAFESATRPQDAFLAGSRDGCEPEETVAAPARDRGAR